MKQAPQHAAADPTRRRIAGAGALGLLALAAGCGGGNTEKVTSATLPTLQISSDVPGDATAAFTVRFTFARNPNLAANGRYPLAVWNYELSF